MRSRKASRKVKKKISNEYVLSVMTFGSETWVLNKATEEMMAVARSKMERTMHGISLRDQKHNTRMCQHIETENMVPAIRRNKHRWAGHVGRFTDSRLTIRATEWSQRPWKRSRGRPKTRWCYDLTLYPGSTWLRLVHADHD